MRWKHDLEAFLRKKGISVLHQNVRGLLNNFTAIEELFSSNKNIDVLTLSETHICNSEDNDKLYKIPNYNFEKRHRKNGKGGGVALYVKDSINYIRRTDLESQELENIVIEIVLSTSKNIFITTLYKPPQSSKYLQNNFNELFNEFLMHLSDESKECILLGDLNCDFLKPADNKEMKLTLSEYGFTQIIKDATRVTKETKTLIDIIATNRPETIANSTVIQSSISDHDLIACMRKLNHKKFSPKTIKCRNYKSYNPQLMNLDFDCVSWIPVLTAPDVNTALNIFNFIVKDIFDKHAPMIEKRIKGRSCPWIDQDLKNIMNQRDKLYRKAKHSKSDADWNAYKTLRNKCVNMQRKAKGVYHKNKINENRLNPKKFWKTVKDIFPTKAGTYNSNTNTASDNRSLADRFRNYFSTAVGELKSKAFKIMNFVWKSPQKVTLRTTKNFRFQYVSKVSIMAFLKKLRRNKATGLDELPPGMLKDCREKIATPLHHIINMSLETATFPSAWKRAKLVPIFKSGDRKNPENYRPISVLPVLSKLLEKSVHSQLLHFLETNKLLNDSQFGYREKRSTQLATTLFVDDIREAAEKGKMVGAVFLDLSKAFDTISHDVILKKLRDYGVSTREMLWFTDYLFNRIQNVKIGSQSSSPFNVTSGVPQGSILGPLIFLIFFNDLQEQLLKAKCIQYADDTVVYVAHDNVDRIERILNEEFEMLHSYFRKNELVLNLKHGKTESILFGTANKLAKQQKDSITITMDGIPVHHVEFYTYLGSQLDSKLTLQNNFEKSYKKATGRLNLLEKLRCYLNTEAAYKIFEMVIVPIIMYSTMISLNLTNTQRNKLISLKSRAERIIGGGVKVKTFENRMKTKACIFVRQCLDGDCCRNFENYFEINNHTKRTRNNGKLVKIPSVKLEFGKKAFKFQGAKIFNELPLSIRDITSVVEFQRKLSSHFD